MDKYHAKKSGDNSQAFVSNGESSLEQETLDSYIESSLSIYNMLEEHVSGAPNLIPKIVSEYNLLVDDLFWNIGELSWPDQEMILNYIGLYGLQQIISDCGIAKVYFRCNLSIRPS